MLRASTIDNIRVIIIDIQESTTPSETPVPTTPAEARMTRIRPNDGTPEPTRPPRPVTRTLTFTPPDITFSTKHETYNMEMIMQKLQNQLKKMKESLVMVQNTYTSINDSSQNMIKEALVEMPYMHVVITESFIKDLDQDTVIMFDMIQLMQENMNAETNICRKIIQDL
ncbi:unnamed protein product [Lactuca saligna]|uniref:Uncharacterized protein n=1 Tax=Lactuca saligna TaxID=75948 RepID=A0AA36E482_LACSI|nr:unnamed protein product [Lactuca saligna]